MDWFVALLALTTAVRGLGAGIIYDVTPASLPAQRRAGAVRYAEYAQANSEVRDFGTYATVPDFVGAFRSDEAPLSRAPDRFARWHALGSARQVAVFVALVLALAYQ